MLLPMRHGRWESFSNAQQPGCCRPRSYKAYGSSKEDAPDCDVPGFESDKMELLRHVSFVDCPGILLNPEAQRHFSLLALSPAQGITMGSSVSRVCKVP